MAKNKIIIANVEPVGFRLHHHGGYLGVSNLGHELHIVRNIIVDLLYKNIANENDIVVTKKDRMFFYSKLFKKVITYSDFNANYDTYTQSYDMIDLVPYLSTAKFDVTDPILTKAGYSISLFDKNGYSHLKDLAKQFDFIDDFPADLKQLTSKKFVVIHFRPTAHIKNHLIRFLATFKEQYNIVIFTNVNLNNNNKNKYFTDKRFYITNNLQLYSSAMHHPNCSLMVTEWSGGGQLSQYCFNGPIFIYFGFYRPSYYGQRAYDLVNSQGHVEWDFLCASECLRLFFPTTKIIVEKYAKFNGDLNALSADYEANYTKPDYFDGYWYDGSIREFIYCDVVTEHNTDYNPADYQEKLRHYEKLDITFKNGPEMYNHWKAKFPSQYENLFDHDYYLQNNPDLIPAGIDNREKALQHWNNHGKHEGRFPHDLEFNYESYYYLHHPHLKNIQDAYNHWKANH